jgi:molecular chaperone GrpE
MSEEHTTPQPETNGSSAEVIDGAATTASAELEARLAQAEAQAAEYKDQWLRATADYKNFKRRADAERSELIRSAGAGLLLKLLPVVDDFDRAIANIPPEVAETPWWGGTQLIAQKLRTLLESEGVKFIEAQGQDFDPNLHEAVLYEDAPGQDGKVVAELQRGYKLHERVLRPAMVKVGRG